MLTTEECPEMNVGTGKFSDDVSRYQNVSILILLELRVTEVVVTTGAIRLAKISPPTNQRPVFYRPDALPVAQHIYSTQTK